MMTPPATPLPLDGVTVVSLEHAVAAPLCTRQLAEIGARVIKIERPGSGDFARRYDARARGMASHFVWTNRSKESMALDLKSAPAQEIMHALLGKADVLVQNLAPGASARMGLSYDQLKDTHPALIVCDISGYGADGPYRDHKAYDLLIQAESGFLSVTGTEDEPVKAGCAIADIAAGMYAYSHILAALLRRARTGQGCRIDVSMLETMVEWMGYPLYYALDDAASPPRSGAFHSTIYPYGPFATADGEVVFVAVQNEREWANFCEHVINRPEFVNDPRFSSNAGRSAARTALGGILDAVLTALPAREVCRRLDAARIAHAQVRQMRDVWRHPQLAARRCWGEVETPVGPLPALKAPGLPDDMRAPMRPVPEVGQHTQAILAELGFPADTLQTDCGAVA